MISLGPSARVSLDDSLTLLGETLGKLKAAKSGDIAEVVEQLKIALESARAVRALVSEELDALIGEIQNTLDAKALEQLRSRLLALATELERGAIVHRRTLRVNELNQLRDRAIHELRSQAELAGTPQTLPGPAASQWIEWACGLKEPRDADSLQALRNGFAHLDEFVANLEPKMWVAAGSPALGIQAEPPRSADKARQEQSRPKTNGFEEPVVTSAALERDEPRVLHSLDEPSQLAVESNTRTSNDVTPPPTDAAEAPRESSTETAIAFDIGTGAEEPWSGKWRTLLVTAAVLALAALGAILWSSHRNPTSNSPVQAMERKVESPSSNEKSPPPLLHEQPVEGAQDKILLTLELCERLGPGSIECWGYVSNQRDQSSEVSLSRADVVDGKGNSFNLSSNGQFDFSTGHTLSVPAGSSVKYTIKIPDKDQDAQKLTLYLDVSKPRNLEYTFRDIPVAD